MKTELPLKEEKIYKEKIILFFSEDIGKPSLRCGPNRRSGSSRYNFARFLNDLWFLYQSDAKLQKKVPDEDKEGSERQGEDIYKSKSTKGKKKNEM